MLRRYRSALGAFWGVLWLGLGLASPAHAVGVFNIPRFVEPDAMAFGLEPEFVMGDDAGVGINARITHGLGSLTHGTFIIGTGNGPEGFRTGGNLVFDFFPDTENQPGLGVAVQGLYINRQDGGAVEFTSIPYLAKTFQGKDTQVTPFIAVPFGWGWRKGPNKWLTTFAAGGIFQGSENLRFILEVGIDVQNTQSYVSGGVVFYP